MKLRPFLVILSAFAAAGAAAACKSTTAPQPAASADTWAVVNGRAISRQDVEKAYRRQQDPAQTVSEEDALSTKLNLLNDLVTQELLVTKAGQLIIKLPCANVPSAI